MYCGSSFADELQMQNGVPLSFSELPKLIRERNDHTKAAEMNVEASRAREGHLGRSYLPQLEANAGVEHFRTGSLPAPSQPFGEVTAKVNIFRGGRDGLEDSIRQQRTELSQAEADSVYWSELTKARRFYWTLVYQREMEVFINEAIQRNQDTLASTRKRLSAGLGTETDRIEFEIQKTNLEQDLARVQLEKKNSERNLNVLVGLNPETSLLIEDKIPHEHSDSLIADPVSVAEHREIRLLNSQYEISEAARKTESRWWAPSIDIYASYGLLTQREREYVDISDRVEAAVGAKITFHLFEGGMSVAEARSLSFESKALELKTAQSHREMSALFQGARDELKLIHELIHGAEKNIEQSKAYLSATSSEYRRGLKNSPDVVGANLRYMDTVRRWAELRRDYQFARAGLLEIVGK